MTINSVTIISPGSGYQGPPSNRFAPKPDDWPVDREYPHKEKPRLGTHWLSKDGKEWANPIGWQGGYVNLETVWGPRLWLDNEFWGWVKEKGAKIQEKESA